MKLLIVTPKVDKDDENLGAFYYWFEELAKHFDEIVIIANSVGVESLPAHVHVHTLYKEHGLGRLRRLWKFWELFSWHYARTDTVLFHMIPEFVLLAAPFLLSNRKVCSLWYAHGSVTWRLRAADKLIDYVFTSSEGGFRLPSKKVFYLGQAIDTKRFEPAKEKNAGGEFRMVSVGRISPVKDYETILRACTLLKSSWSREWSFSIIGGPLLPRDREYLDVLKKFARESGIEKRVYFLGSRHYSEIPLLLREYDLFLNASKTGSLDKAVLEAMACGLPVITANEAYRKILAPKYFLERVSAPLLAERIKAISAELSPNTALREIVISQHSLSATIEKMSTILQSHGNTFAGARKEVRGSAV